MTQTRIPYNTPFSTSTSGSIDSCLGRWHYLVVSGRPGGTRSTCPSPLVEPRPLLVVETDSFRFTSTSKMWVLVREVSRDFLVEDILTSYGKLYSRPTVELEQRSRRVEVTLGLSDPWSPPEFPLRPSSGRCLRQDLIDAETFKLLPWVLRVS